MSDDQKYVTLDELEAKIELTRLKAVSLADEKAEKRIIAAVEAIISNVTLQIGMSEKTLAEKMKTKTAWAVSMFLGGQAIAGLTAALVTRTTPAEATRTALAFLFSLT
jgi:hypothetical protein